MTSANCAEETRLFKFEATLDTVARRNGVSELRMQSLFTFMELMLKSR